MKKTKIFQDAFSEVLKPHGFVYKNKTFIRVIGENIVQSLYLEASSPMYSFEMNIAPAATMAIERGRMFFESMKKEFRGRFTLRFNNFAEFPHISYIEDGYSHALKDEFYDGVTYFPAPYVEGKEVEKCVENMQKAAELFSKEYLPILDTIVDFDSYLEFRERYCNDDYLFSGDRSLNYLELSYKAYSDGSSKFGVEYLRNKAIDKVIWILKNNFPDWELYDYNKYYSASDDFDEFVPEHLRNSFSPSFVQKRMEFVGGAIYNSSENEQKEYKPFWDCVYTNNFNDIASQWADEEKFVLDLIKEAFPKIVLP